MQIQFSHILLVGLGGMLGSILRFITSSWFVQHIPPTWPWGTFIVNMAGCLLIGFVLGAPWKPHTSEMWRLLLASGFCGGFTTFSAFSNEGYQMLKHEMYFLFAAYTLGSIILGLLTVAAGYFLIRSIL
jgi:CrcB protein